MTIEAQPADFDAAFSEFASPEDTKPVDAAAAGTDASAAAASGGAGDGADDVAAAGSGSNGVDGGAGGDAGAASGDAEPKVDDAGAGEADAGAVADAGAEPVAAAPADAGPSPDDILAGLKKLVGQAPEAVAPAEAPAAAAEPAPTYTADEQTFLTDYEKEWADVSKGEALKRRAEYKALLEHVFTQVAAYVKPLSETADALAQRTFTQELGTAVPDYSDKLRSDVIDWAKKQPAYLQVAYNHVITEGTVDEVKDLVDRYRQATGQASPGAVKPATGKTGRGNELSDEAKKAAAALAPVDSKRSGVQAPGDPADFDDAWKQALSGLV